MKTIYLCNILSIIAINMSSCQIGTPNGYTKFQTFDEYKLKGKGNKNIKSPYVFVKESKDTIWVIKSNNRSVVMKYINKGEYWYNFKKKQNQLSSVYKSDTLPYIQEKFIFNDTIMEYSYRIDEHSVKFGQSLDVSTKKSLLCLVFLDDDIKDKNNVFCELKKILSNYKDIFHPYSSLVYQPRYYTTYEKIINKDTLSLYENHINKEGRSLNKILIMNNLEEFDLENAKDVPIPEDERCR